MTIVQRTKKLRNIRDYQTENWKSGGTYRNEKNLYWKNLGGDETYDFLTNWPQHTVLKNTRFEIIGSKQIIVAKFHCQWRDCMSLCRQIHLRIQLILEFQVNYSKPKKYNGEIEYSTPILNKHHENGVILRVDNIP